MEGQEKQIQEFLNGTMSFLGSTISFVQNFKVDEVAFKDLTKEQIDEVLKNRKEAEEKIKELTNNLEELKRKK